MTRWACILGTLALAQAASAADIVKELGPDGTTSFRAALSPVAPHGRSLQVRRVDGNEGYTKCIGNLAPGEEYTLTVSPTVGPAVYEAIAFAEAGCTGVASAPSADRIVVNISPLPPVLQ